MVFRLSISMADSFRFWMAEASILVDWFTERLWAASDLRREPLSFMGLEELPGDAIEARGGLPRRAKLPFLKLGELEDTFNDFR